MGGLKTLYNLLLKDTVKGSGQASGIMSIGDSVRKLAKKKFEAYVATAQRQGVDLDKLSEQEIKYMLELNKPKAPKVYSNEEAYEILSRFANQNKRGKVIKADFGKPFKEEIGSVDNIINDITRMEPIAAMKEVNKVLGKKGKYKNLSKQDSEKIFKDTDDWINQRDPDDLYDYKNKRPFRSEGTKSLFATDKEFADELRSLRLNIIRNDPQFNLEIAERYKLPGGKTYAPYPDKEPGKILSPTQRQKMLDEIKGVMKNDEYRSQFGEDFNFEEIKDEMFRIKKAQGGRTGLSYLLAEDTNERVPYAEGNGVYDEEVAKKKFGERVRQLMDEGYDFGEAVKEAMKEEGFASGGRVPFAMGRRAFLKLMGSVGAGIGALKTGILGLTKGAAPVATEAVKSAGSTASAPPPYFFKLMEKIKFMGEKRKTPSYKERVNEYTYTGKDGSDYELIEDLDTGDIKITKDKIGGRSFEEGSYEVIEDRTEMVFRKGQADETTKGKTPPDEYDEYKVEFDQDGTAADATDIDEISKMEIVEEAGDPDSLTLKKAGGGIARMLGE